MPPIERCPTGGYFRRSTTSRASAALSTCGMTIPSAPLSRARVAIEYSRLGTRGIGGIPASSAALASGGRVDPSHAVSVFAGGERRRCRLGGSLLLGRDRRELTIALGGDLAQMRDDAAGPGGDQASDDDVLLQPLQVVDTAGDRRLCEDAGCLLERGR